MVRNREVYSGGEGGGGKTHKQLFGSVLVEVVVARGVMEEGGTQERRPGPPLVQLLGKRSAVL